MPITTANCLDDDRINCAASSVEIQLHKYSNTWTFLHLANGILTHVTKPIFMALFQGHRAVESKVFILLLFNFDLNYANIK